MQQTVLKGYLLALTGVIILSPDALLVRLAGDEALLISTWRGVMGGIMVLVFSYILDRRNLFTQMRPAGKWAFAVIVLNAVAQFCFIFAISHANVTDVLVIIAFAPLASAFLSAIFLHEVVQLRTWIATLICGIGLAILFLQPDGTSQGIGLFAALICALTVAAQFVVIRGFPRANLSAGVGFGNILAGVCCAFLVTDIMPDSYQWPPLLIMAFLVSPLPFVLFVFSLRYISAAETSLIMLLESVLGSLWVWFILAEQPSVQTVLAGILILSTLSIYTWLALRSSPSGQRRKHGNF
jgi:drug/metabolite transporter (DMT)-like permease